MLGADEGGRPATPMDPRARLGPSSPGRRDHGGELSPLSDGAAAPVVTRRARAEELGSWAVAVPGSPGQVAGPDDSLHSAPEPARRGTGRSAVHCAVAESG
ncbi:hypothetical protein AC792_03480 [Arthrobacter sp. RIT-PI-e]|uniref:hypothetical protein n=1 Tax=Arthrobacter sp. RIT-PI-e TaxID=1681197 RepID=UPI00067648D0|nr:hypothetical protein [Arthrobacter sp. RIT-PI-e]KNC19941.1 hypothetical protein AC792_03480 [Arthrobacter sp. RIT-PI-e]